MSIRTIFTGLVILLSSIYPSVSTSTALPIPYKTSVEGAAETQAPALPSWQLPAFASLLAGAPAVPTDHTGEIVLVNTHLDTPDLMLSDDQCEDQAGFCSLRAAVQSTNYWPGPQTILLETGVYTLTRTGVRENLAVTGDLDISGVLTITASAPTSTAIDGNSIDRVLDILPGAVVVLQNLDVVHGKTPSAVTNQDFTQRYGGGIYNAGDLTLQNVGVGNNTTGAATYDTPQPGMGGGIYSKGNLRIQGGIISYNTTGNGYSGGVYADDGGSGAGIYAQSGVTVIEYAHINHNQTGEGGDGDQTINSYGGDGGDGAGIFAGEVISLTISHSLIDFNVTGMGGAGHGTGRGGPGGYGAGLLVVGVGETLISDTVIADNLTGAGGTGCADGTGENQFCSGGGGAGLMLEYQSDFTLQNTQVLRNTNGPSGSLGAVGADGGGVYCSESTLKISGATIQENHAGAASDGVTYGKAGGSGGGLYAYLCNTTISGSQIVANVAGQGSNGTTPGRGGSGGAIFSEGAGTLTINNSNIMANVAGSGPSAGGGTGGRAGGLSASHAFALSAVSLVNNQAGSAGAGGVGGETGGMESGGAVTMTNSTLSNNSSGNGGLRSGNFGGFYLSGTLNIASSTVAFNQANSYGAGYAGVLNARNSIFANNSAGSNDDCYAINSQGYNLVKDSSDCTINGDPSGNITGADPALEALALTSAGTYAHPLNAASPVIDAANPALPGSGGFACPATDQRGLLRSDFRCDMGAYETQHKEITTIIRPLLPQQPVSFGPLLLSITLQSTTPITVSVENTVTLQQSAAYLPNALPTYWRILQEAQPEQARHVGAGGADPLNPHSALMYAPATALDERLLDLTFCYTDEELGGYSEGLLRLVFWDGQFWIEQLAAHDLQQNCFSQTGVNALGLWGIYQPAMRVYLPVIRK